MTNEMFLWIVAALTAFYVKGLCGFANTLVFTSVLNFGTANVMISPVELILGYPTNMIISWKERKSIDLKLCLPLAALVILGSMAGVFFLKTADTSAIRILFGVVVICVGAEMLTREFSGKKARQSKLLLIVIGILAGFLCGLYGVGALLGAYIGRTTEDSKAFKANICLIFVIENTFRIVLYAVSGIITPEALHRVVLLLPFMFAGLAAGMLSARALNERIAKRVVILLLMVSGAALILTSL